jgi:hypothetical protein
MIINYGSCIVCITQQGNMYVLTVIAVPSDAEITLTAPGYTQMGNQIQVSAGTTVRCEVFAENYVPETHLFTVNATETKTVTLQTGVEFTVNMTPSDAVLTVTIDGFDYVLTETNSICVPSGVDFSYKVSKDGYAPKRRTANITEPTTVSITLEPGIAVDLDNYEYNITDDGDAELLTYTGTDTDVTVP